MADASSSMMFEQAKLMYADGTEESSPVPGHVVDAASIAMISTRRNIKGHSPYAMEYGNPPRRVYLGGKLMRLEELEQICAWMRSGQLTECLFHEIAGNQMRVTSFRAGDQIMSARDFKLYTYEQCTGKASPSSASSSASSPAASSVPSAPVQVASPAPQLPTLGALASAFPTLPTLASALSASGIGVSTSAPPAPAPKEASGQPEAPLPSGSSSGEISR